MTRLSRRHALFGGLTLAVLAACAEAPTLADPDGRPTLVDPVEPLPPAADRIAALERRYDALIGLYAVDLATGRSLAHRAGDSFAVCSTFKAYAAARVLQMAGRGQLALDDTVRVDPAAVVDHSPVTAPKAGASMTFAELCQAALQVSDNTAANLLLTAIGGPPAITAFARSIGDDRTRLDRWETELNSAIPGDPRDTSTPEALGTGFRNLLVGDALAPPQREQLATWMRANQTSSMRAGLPADWSTADKTGSGGYGSTNDVGIVDRPDGRRLLLSIMTRSAADDPNAGDLRRLIGELAALTLPAVFG